MRVDRLFRLAAWVIFAATFASCGRADEVDERVKSELVRQHIPGAAIVVVRDGKVIKAQGYGLADVEHALPAKADTVFQIQSITKQFTATGVMMLVEEGKIQLDDPISKYLDGTPPSWEKITVRHLLSQTSGLKDFINDPVPGAPFGATDEELMQTCAARPLNFQPGDAWAYSNTNYHLLAMIIRKVSGQWYGDFLAQRIFKPLGMEQTAVMRAGESVPGSANGYVVENGKLGAGSPIPPSLVGYGGGGIRSTVLDLAKWDAALNSEQLLKRATLEQMWTPVKLNNGTTHNYGFGWEIDSINNHGLIWHAGNFSSGFSGQIDRFVDDHLTVVVLTNLYDAMSARIAREVASVYLPALAPPVYKAIPDTEPNVTQRFRDLLDRSREGKLRSDDFTPLAWTYVEPLADQLRKDMTAIGPIEKLTLVERTDQDGNRSYRYRAQFKNTTFIMHFVLTKDDKVSAMMPEEVNQ